MKGSKGFTLVELVVVILILGILAGVAAPKLFDTSAKATDNSVRTSLAIIRDAIELYAAENGSTPTWTDEATFKSDLDPYLRGSLFPTCPVGANAGASTITNATTTGGAFAWRYDATTGEFFINDGGASASGIGNYDTF